MEIGPRFWEGFLSPCSTDALGGIILCFRGCVVHCRIPGLFPPDASSTSPPTPAPLPSILVTIKNVPLWLGGEGSYLWLRSTV